MTPSLLTIGHSRHSLEKLLGLLAQHRVEMLVDVRSQPVSRFSPHLGRRALEPALGAAGFRYLFLGDALGGRPRPRECYGPDGTVDYDLVEQQPFYQRGIERLSAELATARAAIMCAEEDPARCHRRLLVARTLVRRGVEVRHIRGTGAVSPEEELRATPASAQLPLLAR